MENEFLKKLGNYADSYQKKCTSFRTPTQVLLALADGVQRLDLSPFEFQITVAHLVTDKLGRDVSIKQEALLIALKEALNGNKA